MKRTEELTRPDKKWTYGFVQRFEMILEVLSHVALNRERCEQRMTEA
jgi:hypothetical protein